MSYNTRVQYLVDPGQRQFDVSIPYLDRNDIKVSVNGVPQAVTWISDSRLDLGWQPNANSVVEIRRVTPISHPKVEFNDGSNLTERELNDAVRQLLFHEQETSDTVTGSLDAARVRLGDSLGVVTNATAVADEVLRISELGDDLLNRMRDAVAGVDLNAATVVEHALRLNDQAANTALLTSTVAGVTGAVGAVNGRVDSLQGVIDGLLDVGNGEGIGAVIANEAASRVEGDTALAATFALLGARSQNNQAFILNTGTVRVSPTETLANTLSAINANTATTNARIVAEETARANAVAAEASRINGLLTRVGAAEANIQSEATARTNGDTSLAQLISLLGAANGGNNAFVLDMSRVYVSPTESLTQRHNAMIAQAVTTAGTAAQALVQTESTARATANSAVTSVLTGHNSRIGGVESGLASEITTRAAADAAETTARQALASTVAANLAAAINSEQTTRANAIAAEALARQQLAAVVGGNTSAIQNEAQTRATADSSMASQLALLGAATNGGTAWAIDLTKVQVGGGVSLGTRLSGIDTAAGNNAAAIANEISARSDAVSAVAQSLSTLSSTVGGNTSSITNLQTVTNGLSARAGIALNVNGRIIGWTLNNNGQSGDMNILVDKFAVVNPNNNSPFVPFEISGGVVRIKEAAIGSVNVGVLTAGTLTQGMIVGATNKIVIDGANNRIVIYD